MDSVTEEDRTWTHCTMALDGYSSKAVNETRFMKLKGNANRFL